MLLCNLFVELFIYWEYFVYLQWCSRLVVSGIVVHDVAVSSGNSNAGAFLEIDKTRAVFEKTCATTRKNIKSHVFGFLAT